MSIPLPLTDAPVAGLAGGIRFRHWALVVLLALGTLNALDGMVMAALITPVKAALGLSDQAIGVVVSVTTLAGIVGAPLFGVLAGRVARRTLLAVAAVIWSLTSAGAALADGVLALLLWRGLTGFATAAYHALVPGWLADLYDSRGRSVVFSLFMLRNKVGSALAFGLGAALAAHYDWHVAFLATGLPGVILALAVLTLREPKPGEADGVKVAARAPTLREQARILKIGAFKVHLVALVFFYAGVTTAQLWFPAYLHRVYGISNQAAAGYLSIVMMATLPVGVVGGWLTGKYLVPRATGVAASLAISSGLAAVLFVGAFATRSLPLAQALAAAAIVAFGATAGSLTLLAVETVPPAARSFAGSLAALISTGISGGVAPWLLGVLSDRYGLPTAIYLGPACYALAALVWGWAVLRGVSSKAISYQGVPS
ncbi:MFS transporter [Nitrospirillum sp. BR 11163]|uniref:MFS transporter n=1 Tax=Nitrospirillum sp. BR 11163 TaxID=3104323 RepID=UPI002AFF58E0|nr:MFS transporter [Nitrospirillum sp. BR 11163]MEA1674650.1 MFS transporter [Nitrospirillum sp. BR 11163]